MVDDCSTDNSPQIIRETVEELYRSDRAFEIDKRLVHLVDRNQGRGMPFPRACWRPNTN